MFHKYMVTIMYSINHFLIIPIVLIIVINSQVVSI